MGDFNLTKIPYGPIPDLTQGCHDTGRTAYIHASSELYCPLYRPAVYEQNLNVYVRPCKKLNELFKDKRGKTIVTNCDSPCTSRIGDKFSNLEGQQRCAEKGAKTQKCWVGPGHHRSSGRGGNHRRHSVRDMQQNDLYRNSK